jgi:hypothetical protein
MKKILLLTVILLVSFNANNIYGQQNTIKNDNILEAESVNKDSVSGNVNSTNSVPKDSGEINNDKSGDSAKVSPNDSKVQNSDAAKNVPVNKNEQNKNTDQKQLTNIKTGPERSIVGNGLLEINEGAFKYKRIPGISLNTEKSIFENSAEEKVNYSNDSLNSNENKVKDSFGIKKSTAVLILLVMLVGIIIVFKIRSKTMGGKKIFRRFPGTK